MMGSMNARTIAQTVLMVLLVLILAWLIFGCDATRKQHTDVKNIRVQADFEKKTIDVKLDREEAGEDEGVKVNK